MKSVILLAALAISAASAANAKVYNQPRGVPSEAQAAINRIMADVTATSDGGKYGAFESDCGELAVGAGGTANGDQVIVADKIINVSGHCRIVRSSGVFPTTPSNEQPEPEATNLVFQ